MEYSSKNDFIDVYVSTLLNEIKNIVRKEIDLKDEKILKVDAVMKSILIDLISDKIDEIKEDYKGDLIYSLLPLSNITEQNKVRKIFALLYTAIYFNNVSLLKKMLASGIEFVQHSNLKDDRLLLLLLDSSITSHFEENEYIEIIKKHKNVFQTFYDTISKLEDNDKEIYINKFVNVLKNIKISLNSISANNLFKKNNMRILDDKSFLLASDEQLQILSQIYLSVQKPESIIYLNRLIQETKNINFDINYDLMTSLFTLEQLLNFEFPWVISSYFERFKNSDVLLEKAMDLYKKYPNIVSVPYGKLNYDLVKFIDNDLLISMIKDSVDLNINSNNIKKITRDYKCKVFIKKLLKK